jgi:hypothetical protein
MPERRMTRIALECRRPVQNKHARGAEQQEHVTEELAIVKKIYIYIFRNRISSSIAAPFSLKLVNL